jgi:tetratricopeptide (TPR) repeat protein
MNRMAPAIKALEDANHIEPNNGKVSWKLGKMYFNYGQWDKVIVILPQARKQMPDAAGYDFMMGKSYYSIQNYGKGISHLQKAIKEDDQNAEAYYLIGHMYSLMDNYKPGIPYYEKALTIGTGEGSGVRIYEYAMVLATAGEYDASIKWFKKALDSGYPARDDFYMNFAYALADANKSDKAIVMMEEMLERRPQDLSLLNGIADVCYHAGKYKKAIQYWDKVLVIDESNARSLYHIGLAYIKMGNTTDGQTLCDKAILMDPALAVLKHEKKM